MRLTMYRGDTANFTIAITTPDGAPIDLSGAYLWFTAKTSTLDTDGFAIFQKSVGDGISITDAVGGIANVQLDEGDTSTLTHRVTLQYDVQVKDSLGGIYTVARGPLVIEEDITLTTV